MKKLLLLPVCLALFIGQFKLDASVQTLMATAPITQLSFTMNNVVVPVAPATISSIMGALNSGKLVTFTSGLMAGESSQIYNLTVSSLAWPTNQAYPVITPMALNGSCFLQIPGQSAIAMPMTQGGTVSVQMLFPSPANYPVMISGASNSVLARTVHLGALGDYIKNAYLIDAAGNKVIFTGVANLNNQYQTMPIGKSISFRVKGNGRTNTNEFAFLLDSPYGGYGGASVTVPTTAIGYPLSLYINRTLVATIATPWSDSSAFGGLLCILQK